MEEDCQFTLVTIAYSKAWQDEHFEVKACVDDCAWTSARGRARVDVRAWTSARDPRASNDQACLPVLYSRSNASKISHHFYRSLDLESNKKNSNASKFEMSPKCHTPYLNSSYLKRDSFVWLGSKQ